MRYSKLHYSQEELSLQNELNTLFQQIESHFDATKTPHGHTKEDLVVDGFFPQYLAQQCKILFIGRESLWMSGENYIDTMYRAYTKEKLIGDRHLNQHRFHALMLYLAYGLNNGQPNWANIPAASDIADDFAKDSGVSFSFMNYSKLSNDSDSWQADWPLIDGYIDSVASSPVNVHASQIDLLCPNIILTMNLEGRLKTFGELKLLEGRPEATYYRLNTGNNSYLLIDLYHFSAIKNMEQCFYNPVVEGLNLYGD
ncbi:hypothetical protein BCT86_09935 [Vibrio breoganii]|uniref:hypothetical protein n=1 Tax=Vibrio breoganii TaxID=553239 RepID=UPI000C843603|nr:hypothetical protein [Vibrio breoganii]PML07189.1 hypothetical protein BCT86_09935 [Vibrio breoganii]